ncbi:DNA recombination and repair protein RecO [Arcticibacter svalbardensis MN12-7]|uniref:DNA repair protein RecO n=1 Tax=Arcticibacter svalbardensis MN12-7 TaxID=1150600 RepID=R9GLH5_9SPHI|nr:DNA repair protein RecO [Arcticibacter svalbardensis]EOR92662.1 DNA recombination and repair protein RecO [Arcticibacter svalbardensis MN12-7]
MLHKTRGIVFKTTVYSESSVVAQIFTEKFGLQSYLVNGARKPKAKIRMNMIQPLHLLDMVVYHKPNGNIQRISELRNAPLLETIPYDLIKSSLVLFLNEVLYKVVRQHHDDVLLFEFIFHSIILLDKLENGLGNFHLWFLLHLSKYLGFYPERTNENISSYFDLKNGVFTNFVPGHAYYLHGKLTSTFSEILVMNVDSMHLLKISSVNRKDLLSKVLDYYRMHIDNFGEIHSHKIIEEVFNS